MIFTRRRMWVSSWSPIPRALTIHSSLSSFAGGKGGKVVHVSCTFVEERTVNAVIRFVAHVADRWFRRIAVNSCKVYIGALN